MELKGNYTDIMFYIFTNANVPEIKQEFCLCEILYFIPKHAVNANPPVSFDIKAPIEMPHQIEDIIVPMLYFLSVVSFIYWVHLLAEVRTVVGCPLATNLVYANDKV